MDEELKVIEPPEEDLQEFVRSILGNRQFEKTYKLYNKAVTFTFRSLSISHNSLMDSFRQQLGTLSQFPDFVSEAGVVLYTTQINDIRFPKRPDILTPEEVHCIFIKEFTDVFPSTTKKLLYKTLSLFLDLEDKLLERAFDPNF